jgi:hypothetical protein
MSISHGSRGFQFVAHLNAFQIESIVRAAASQLGKAKVKLRVQVIDEQIVLDIGAGMRQVLKTPINHSEIHLPCPETWGTIATCQTHTLRWKEGR